jgi:hypothetical protein
LAGRPARRWNWRRDAACTRSRGRLRYARRSLPPNRSARIRLIPSPGCSLSDLRHRFFTRFLTRLRTAASFIETGGQFYPGKSRKTTLIGSDYFLPVYQGFSSGGNSALSCHGNFWFYQQPFGSSPQHFEPGPMQRELDESNRACPPKYRGVSQMPGFMRPKLRERHLGIVSCAGIILICRQEILSRRKSLASWQQVLLFLRRAGRPATPARRRHAQLKTSPGKLFLTK